jgi:glycosyltransferase involved in cell wall biosynthesis
LVTGGSDVVPPEKYGLERTYRVGKVARLCLRIADLVLFFSESSMRDAEGYMGKLTSFRTVHFGFDYDTFRPNGRKDDTVLTVGYYRNPAQWIRKRMDIFMKVADRMPEIRFVLVGPTNRDLCPRVPNNVHLTGEIDDVVQLVKWFQRARVYMQISSHEGFGHALAQSMLCGCVPVVVDRGAIREVVGDCGVYADYGSVESTVEAVKKARNARIDGRARIIRLFKIESRAKKLNNAISELCRPKC